MSLLAVYKTIIMSLLGGIRNNEKLETILFKEI